MRSFPNLERLLTVIDDSSSRIHHFYLRNAAELISLFPVIGPFIKANTLGAIQDRQLQKRLSELELKCGQLLDSVNEQRLKVAAMEVNFSFGSLLTEYHEPLLQAIDHRTPEAVQYRELLLTFFLTPRGLQTGPSPIHPRFRIVFIAGASATGKDALLDLVLDHYIESGMRRCETLTKFTTRPPRVSEARYYKFCSEHEFDWNLYSGEIIFPYTKRNARYGFDRKQLAHALGLDVVLFAVLTEFTLLPKVRSFLHDQGVATLAILIEAPKIDLIHRSWNRVLPEADVRRRIKSIDADIEFIEMNSGAVDSAFDHRVTNSNDRAIHDTRNQIVQLIDEI